MKKSYLDKIQTWEQARQTVEQWQNLGLNVVFTNGCFDLLHVGHIAYLEEAASCGDKLVVGLNADASISRLKGTHRPINDERSRSAILAALAMVDLVVVFGEDTPLELITLLRPDVLVKGGDYRPETIVGADIVWAHGGDVLSLSFVDGYSTSALERKIIEAHKDKPFFN